MYQIGKEKRLFWNKNQEKNKVILIQLLLILGIIACILFYKFSKIEKNANQIFYDSLDSIVELMAESSTQKSYGTAVFIDNHILVTNSHVITYKSDGELVPYESLYIRLAKDEDYREVSLVKYDEDLDIAVLQLADTDADGKSFDIADSDTLDFGDKVYAIGNSMNGGLSISEGIIGIPDVFIEYEGTTREAIQADITIASGNSGGALVNSKGELVGITSFRIKDSSGEVVYGTAYSIPINQVMSYLKK